MAPNRPESAATPAPASPDPQPSGRRWLARASLAAMVASGLVVVASAGFIGLTLVAVGLIGASVTLAGGYWFLAERGVRRWAGLTLAVIAICWVVLTFFRQELVAVALISLALLALGGTAARHALRHTAQPWMPTTTPPPARHPFIVMNPRSGGGKVNRYDLKNKAEQLGAEVTLLDGPGQVDIPAIVHDAIRRGADLLGVAGGDGTQALVAGIAADDDLPLLVISAGTRNHFALDLGLDRDDPASCLQALTDGEEVRVDLGVIAGRPFVNNASFGAYAEIVQSPEYRDNKERTILNMLPDLLSEGAHLTVRTGTTGRDSGPTTLDDVQAALISNNPYGSGRLLDLGRRTRLDQGVLGIIAGRLGSVTRAVGLLRRAHGQSIKVLTGHEVVVDSTEASIPVGIDGEAVTVDTPVQCTIRPRALRVRLPKNRPGVPPPRIDWKLLWHIAFDR